MRQIVSGQFQLNIEILRVDFRALVESPYGFFSSAELSEASRSLPFR
jgi:hypothetical protein